MNNDLIFVLLMIMVVIMVGIMVFAASFKYKKIKNRPQDNIIDDFLIDNKENELTEMIQYHINKNVQNEFIVRR